MLKHKLIQWQTPFLLKCANKVDPFSKALFLGGFCNEFTSFTGTEPCSCGNHRAEYIHCFIWPSASGLNWDLGWWANDWTAMPKKKIGKKERKKRSRKKEGGLLLQCKVKHHFKWSVWEWEQLSQSMASPGVQLPSTSVSMSSSIPLQIHPTSPIYQGSNDPTL